MTLLREISCSINSSAKFDKSLPTIVKFAHKNNMALKASFKDTEFGVGDRVKITQRIKEEGKKRSQVFEGIVIGIKGREENKTFTVRRVGAQQIGIERIFPFFSPSIEKVETVREGGKGVKRAKLYYTRFKSPREIEKIYSRAQTRKKAKRVPKKKSSKKSSKK